MLRFFCISSALLLVSIALAQESASPTEKPKPIPAPSEPKITVSSVPVDGPYIALTFDDGPNEKLTPRLLDLLAQHHIHATFFVIGENVAQHPEIVKRAAREGYEIGNHSWSHPNLAKMSDENVRDQIKRTEEVIRGAIGARPVLLRPPYGSLNARQKHFIHDELGYEIVLWDVDPYDWKRPGPSVVTNRILKETRPGSIVLSHDIHPGTIEAMPATLSELEAKGFKFVTVSELLRMARTQPSKTMSASVASPAPAAPKTGPSPNG